MSEPKVKPIEASVEDFFNEIFDSAVREECRKTAALMRKATRENPKMWGASIVGFGVYHYEYASGRIDDTSQISFSPRRQNITLYLSNRAPLDKFYRTNPANTKPAKAVLYIKNLNDVDGEVLEKIIEKSVEKLG